MFIKKRSNTTAITVCLLLIDIFPNVKTSTESKNNDLKIIISQLEKITTLLKTAGTISEKLLANLRDNATRQGSSADVLSGRGYNCAPEIGWHKLYLENVTWNEARKSCRDDGARLAVVNSGREAEALKNLLLENYQFSAYIGIHNQFKEDEWISVSGEPLDLTGYNRWSVGPPKISLANCAVLFEDGKLLGIPCKARRSYFCEIPGISGC